MKNLRRMFAIALLSFTFSISAYADGDMHAGRTSAPVKASTTTSESYGEISRGVKQALVSFILTLL